jgi:hypothetical protein
VVIGVRVLVELRVARVELHRTAIGIDDHAK